MTRVHPSFTALIATVLSLGVLTASPRVSAYAAEAVVPAAVQAALTVRVLEYDRSLKTWAPNSLSVGLVTRKSGGASEYRSGLEGQRVQGLPVTVSAHVYQGADALARWIDQEGIQLVYISPELSGEAGAVASAATRAKRPSLAATRAQFEAGGTLGIVVRAGKPHILVHLPGSKAAGMNLDPKLLQLAEVVR